MNYKLAQLSLSPGKNAGSTGDIFVSQIDKHKEFLAGQLFVLVEISGRHPSALKIISFLVDTLNRNYYQSEKILLRERISTLKVEHIFEAALAKTNKNFREFLEDAKIKINYADICVSTGVIHEDSIYLSSNSKNKAFLIYPENAKIQNADNENYKISDINADSSSTDKDLKSEKSTNLFSSVLSGAMPARSYFFITNEALPEYLSKSQIIKTISVLPPAGAIEHIKQALSGINAYVLFLGLIIKSRNFPPLPEKTPVATDTGARDSIINLNQTENTTEELLATPGIINPKKWLALFSAFWGNYQKRRTSASSGMLAPKDRIFFKKNASLLRNNIIIKSCKNVIIHSANIIFYIFKSFSTKKDIAAFGQKLKSKSSRVTLTPFYFIKNLTFKNKALLLVVLACLLIFSFNLKKSKTQKENAESEQKYKEISALIEQKQNQAEANILFSNDEGAKKLYEEIKMLMGKLPQKNDEQTQKYSDFDEKYNVFLDKIRRVSKMDQLEKIADFGNLAPGANVGNIILSAKNQKIYAGDSAQKSIYVASIKDKTATVLPATELSFDNFLYPALSGEKELLYFSGANIARINLENDGIEAISANSGSGVLTDMEVFNSNLYALDPKSKQIIRYSFSGSSLSSPYKWLKKPLEAESALDFTIDGSIYLLAAPAQVFKFLRGDLQDFSLSAAEPELKNPTKIFTNKDINSIYILEPQESRVVVYDKTGQFLRQYQNKELKNLKDFIIDEPAKIIYLLDGNTVYRHSLEVKQ